MIVDRWHVGRDREREMPKAIFIYLHFLWCDKNHHHITVPQALICSTCPHIDLYASLYPLCLPLFIHSIHLTRLWSHAYEQSTGLGPESTGIWLQPNRSHTTTGLFPVLSQVPTDNLVITKLFRQLRFSLGLRISVSSALDTAPDPVWPLVPLATLSTLPL